jgi:hypothetical protein
MDRGSPRQVNGRDPLEHPKVVAKTESLSSDTLLGTIIVLLKLILSLVDIEKLFRRHLRKKTCLVSPSTTISVSFAY